MGFGRKNKDVGEWKCTWLTVSSCRGCGLRGGLDPLGSAVFSHFARCFSNLRGGGAGRTGGQMLPRLKFATF